MAIERRSGNLALHGKRSRGRDPANYSGVLPQSQMLPTVLTKVLPPLQ